MKTRIIKVISFMLLTSFIAAGCERGYYEGREHERREHRSHHRNDHHDNDHHDSDHHDDDDHH